MTFTVEDNGVGISEEDLARVGEPYFQAGASYDRRHGGTGLGLSIVKGLVRLQGGDIVIRSRLGEGTRVTVQLPLDCEVARLSKTSSAKVPGNTVTTLAANAAAPAASAVPLHEVPLVRPEMPVRKSA
jgi:two-component system, cell cycle sensor histidine kinase DivJ